MHDTTISHDTRLSPLARSTAAVIAALIAVAYATDATLGMGSIAQNAAGMLRYFTIWGNVAAAFILGSIAMGRPVSRAVMASLITALSVIGLVYWTVLAGDHNPQGLGIITNQVFHTITPIAVFVWWLAFTPPAERIAAMVPAIMVPPLSYGLFAFIFGELSGFYAYFFLALPELGWTTFLINNAGLAAFFGVFGSGLLLLHRRFARLR